MSELFILALAGTWFGARQPVDDDDDILLTLLIFPLVAMVAMPWIVWTAIRGHGGGRVTSVAYSLLVLLTIVGVGYLTGWVFGLGAWLLAVVAGIAGLAHAGRRKSVEESVGEGVPSWHFS